MFFKSKTSAALLCLKIVFDDVVIALALEKSALKLLPIKLLNC